MTFIQEAVTTYSLFIWTERHYFHYKIPPLLQCIRNKWLLKAPSAIWALTCCTHKSWKKNQHHTNVHPLDLMAPTDNSTAKIGKTKSSSFTMASEGVQSHLYCIVRLSTSLIPPYAINSTKEKLKIKPIVQFLGIYLAFLSLLMSYSHSFVTSEMHIITISLHSWTGFLINYYSWTEYGVVVWGFCFGLVLFCYFSVIVLPSAWGTEVKKWSF